MTMEEIETHLDIVHDIEKLIHMYYSNWQMTAVSLATFMAMLMRKFCYVREGLNITDPESLISELDKGHQLIIHCVISLFHQE